MCAKEIKTVDQVNDEHTIEYLKFRQNQGKISYTIRKDMVALNELFNTRIRKKDASLNSLSYKDLTRSRGEKAHYKKYNPENYKD